MSEGRKGLFGLFKKTDETEADPAPEDPAAPSQTEMRLRIEEFERARVDDVMIPRAEIIGVELSTPLDELIQLYATEAHSRLPVYRETLDDPVGVVHIRDVMIDEMGPVRDLQAGERHVPDVHRWQHDEAIYRAIQQAGVIGRR